jgi:pantoate--beta-alanine ligase
MEIARTEREALQHAGGVLVPTMGALHEGHEVLIRRAVELRNERGLTGGVVVSVFVNPAQFDERRDFDDYPRDLAKDAAICERLGADAVFAPDVETVYPGGKSGSAYSGPIRLPGCVVGKGLEDTYRPGHFDGVYRVCKRLFELCRPACAVFGQKDWQQLLLVTEMSAAEGLGVDVIGAETVRETGERAGLAMSSRNVHLTRGDIGASLGLISAIRAAQAERDPAEAERAARLAMFISGARIEYAAVRDSETMGPVHAGDPGDAAAFTRPGRILVAARVGATRLIDNDAWPG